MKLPEDKSERLKILAMIGIFGLGGLYAAFTFGLGPIIDRHGQRRQEIIAVQERLQRADREIRTMPHHRRQNAELIDRILTVVSRNRYVLRSDLGNYQLVARDIVREKASELDLKVTQVQPLIPQAAVAGPLPETLPPEPGSWFKPYGVIVMLECGLMELMELIDALESSNPLLCITALSISTRADTPERHNISFNVTWPIWDNEIWADALFDESAQGPAMP